MPIRDIARRRVSQRRYQRGRHTVTAYVTAADKSRLAKYAKAVRMTESGLIRWALNEFLETSKEGILQEVEKR